MVPWGWEGRRRFEKAYAQTNRREALPGHFLRHQRAHHRPGCPGYRPRDEVIIPPYTFVAYLQRGRAELCLSHLCGFGSRDVPNRRNKIEKAITKPAPGDYARSPGGSAADLEHYTESGRRPQDSSRSKTPARRIWPSGGRKVGTWGTAGCFSFQASKNLNSGEGGAVLTNNDETAEILYNFQQPGPGTT